jgi:two-component system, response regulator
MAMNNKPILLVDDNPDDVTFALRAFKRNNISNEIVVAIDGEQALQMLLPADAAQPFRPALVLLDLKLPKVGGLEVLERLRADPRTRSLPVVVLTTSSEDADIASSYQLGANSFVRKPVVFSEFLDAARMLGLYWLLINQPVPE